MRNQNPAMVKYFGHTATIRLLGVGAGHAREKIPRD